MLSKRQAILWAAVGMLLVSGCGDDGEGPAAPPPGSGGGFVEEAAFQQRALQYWQFATRQLAAGSPLNVIAHLERARVDASYTVPAGSIPVTAWDAAFQKMATLRDTRDFDALYLLNVYLGYRDDPALAPGLADKLAAALIAFKFWYTEPTAEGLQDDSWYWSENHEIIFHTIEYLVGQTFPDATMTNDGRSGREHMEHARPRILRWFDLRARFGFNEWHSNVYYQKDVTPLLTLVEYAEDPAIRERAAAILDAVLFDIAMHTFRGAFGVTHGRSYKKDKMSSLDDDTWGLVKLLFDTAEYPYGSGSDPGAVLLARAKRYRLPEAIFRIARSDEPFVDRERMGLDIDEDGPYEPNPQAPYELSYSDPDQLTVWWSAGALTAWPVVPLTIQVMNQYNLWDTQLFAPFSGLRNLVGDIPFAQDLAIRMRAMLGFGLLKEVNTYTYRSSDFMLSSAIDYRAGSFGAQYHSWQATFDPNAIVFTNHAFRPPIKTTDWYRDDETGSYWTGEASMPRSAQHENVAIHIYAPQYRQTNPGLFEFFRYEPYTHAYFPQDHFDEVVQEGHWTFGRFRDGYIGLYSFRLPKWVIYDPTEYATNGMIKPFDLRADGGPDNVWIVECGRGRDWESFAAFRTALSAATVEIEQYPRQAGLYGGFDVVYQSPSQGRMSFGWQQPLVVGGQEQAVSGFDRWDNPFARTPVNSRSATIEKDGYGVRYDIEAGRREVYRR